MGRGTRHSKSCQSRGFLTYDERNARTNAYRGRGVIKVALEVDQGTLTERVGADSQKDFDACWLCNGRAERPVVTPSGMLYCKECILSNIVAQKAGFKRKQAAFEEQQCKRARKEAAADAVRGAIAEEFARAGEDSLLPAKGEAVAKDAAAKAHRLEQAVQLGGCKEQTPSSFWTAQNTPAWEEGKVEKPDGVVRCPFTNKPLKMKQLVDVKWTEQREAEGLSVQAEVDSGRYMCPISNVTFRRGCDIVILPNGHAVSKRAYERVCKGPKEGAEEKFRCPITGDSLTHSAVIHLFRGATGFAASVVGQELASVEASQYRPSMGVS
eukprot:Hpha_TRINITY_DN35138_c0_g1::TRINITY_DN35138_c0_g1_i1::g.168527::m.168527/K13125/NOSIP; nitric oxide synthase-interacting protein